MGKHSFLQVEQLEKRYPAPDRQSLCVFENVGFTIEKGEFVCVIGHSGCGKSTLLSIIAGLDRASAGYVFMAGREVTGPSLDRGVIFQNHSLLPWKSAIDNVCFSVRARHPDWSRRRIRESSQKFIEMVGLGDASQRRPSQLSGGMRQRVGIARAFAIEPKLLLMDEPFGALDALTRGSIQDQLIAICQETHQTVFMITHDVDEAIFLSDRILLMSNGPAASIAEAVPVDLPRPRTRAEIIHEPRYYDIRNHLIGFLTGHARGAPAIGGHGTAAAASERAALVGRRALPSGS
jgi:nitrate/nitrite transport system ATP-binding protein